MSEFLALEHDPFEQSAASDPVERRTWCALRVRVGGQVVTRIWDKSLEDERSLLYVPAFPIAEWLVGNWWVLLNEPSRSDELAKPFDSASQISWIKTKLPWVKRHCLRSAESGLLLPALYLYSDGRGIRAEWQADERGSFPHMPGNFVDSGFFHLDSAATADALARFVNEVLGRVRGMQDERVTHLQRNWQAIQEADAEEVAFCVTAGRMGMNPYDSSQLNDGLASFIENSLDAPDVPLQRDLAEVAGADSVVDQWSWVTATRAAFKLGPRIVASPAKASISAPPSPSQYGYLLAEMIRRLGRLDTGEPVRSIESTARVATDVQFRSEEKNHIPGRGIRAMVGWTTDRTAVLAGPRSGIASSHRFLEARGLYHALFACDRSERLVTDACTWDQQASRAFAAELLAPRTALLAKVSEFPDRAEVERLAEEFMASRYVIERQLQNAGIFVVDE